MIGDDAPFGRRELFFYAAGQLPAERAQQIAAACREDEELAATVKFYERFAAESRSESSGSLPRVSLSIDQTSNAPYQSAVDHMLAAITAQLRERAEDQLAPSVVLQPVVIQPLPSTLAEVFRDSVWNTRRAQTALVVVFAAASLLFGLLWRHERQSERHERDDVRLEVLSDPSNNRVFRIFGDHDKKLYLRSSLESEEWGSLAWFDLDPFDPPPRWDALDGVFQSLHRVIDPVTARETFVLELVPDFEGFVELYHDGRQITIVRLRDEKLPVSASPKEAQRWMEERYRDEVAEVQRLFEERNRLQNATGAGSTTERLKRDYELARSREGTFYYCIRRMEESPQLFLWSQVTDE